MPGPGSEMAVKSQAIWRHDVSNHQSKSKVSSTACSGWQQRTFESAPLLTLCIRNPSMDFPHEGPVDGESFFHVMSPWGSKGLNLKGKWQYTVVTWRVRESLQLTCRGTGYNRACRGAAIVGITILIPSHPCKITVTQDAHGARDHNFVITDVLTL